MKIILIKFLCRKQIEKAIEGARESKSKLLAKSVMPYNVHGPKRQKLFLFTL